MWPISTIAALIIIPMSVAFSGNDPLVSYYNQLFVYKELCAASGLSQLRKYTGCNDYGIKNLFLNLSTSAELLEHLVFQDSASEQIKKNKCLLEKLNLLRKPKYFEIYKTMLIGTYLRQKKSELIYEKCRQLLREKEANERGTKAWGNFYKKTKFDPEWEKLCSNSEIINFTRSSARLFPYAIPIVSSQELIQTVDKNRDFLFNSATKKPITDEDLLTNDLCNLNWVDPDPYKTKDATKNFSQSVTQLLNYTADKREHINVKLNDSRSKNGQFDLDENMKEYLYEDGSVESVLIQHGLIKESHINQELSGYSPGAACIMSRYEHAPILELSEGLIALLLLKGKSPSKNKTATAVFDTGKVMFTLLGSNMMFKNIYKYCSDFGMQDRQSDSRSQEVELSMLSKSVPSGLCFNRYSLSALEEDPELSPSCRKKSVNLNLNGEFRILDSQVATCISNLLTSTLRLEHGIPASILMSEVNRHK